MSAAVHSDQEQRCYHCGDQCPDLSIQYDGRNFCCEGCKMVFKLLERQNLCNYYDLNKNPGLSQRIKVRQDKFAFLDDEEISRKLIDYQDEKHVRVTFYLPQVHCSSCLYLLENLHRINPGIVSGKVNFAAKELSVVFLTAETSLRKVVETLTSAGYEPYISLNDLKGKKVKADKGLVYKLGVAGFCFGNIMLMSFPEYLGIEESEAGLRNLFRWLNFLLSIPVLFYSALPFYRSSISGLKHKFLNIDTPIALAIIITFIRSVYEVVSGTGGGYFDSVTGIVFFMLAGRILQDRTYRQLAFDRDYTSYFPIAVSVLKDGQEISTALPSIRTGDSLLIHNEELIPADGILTRGKAFIDYSFVTGESLPVPRDVGEIVYAGGRQTGGNIEILTIKEVAHSYLARLWDGNDGKRAGNVEKTSFVHVLSRYFTYVVLFIAACTAVFWQYHDPSRIWPAVTAVFIVACPCALLLSSTFTYGNILRALSHNQFFLKNAATIEEISKVTHIVFDKTGTLSQTNHQLIRYHGKHLDNPALDMVRALVGASTHPLSRALASYLGKRKEKLVSGFKENTGFGIEGKVDDVYLKLGSYPFVTGETARRMGTSVFVGVDGKVYGYFRFHNQYRDGIVQLLRELKDRYRISILSGDNNNEGPVLRKFLGRQSVILFNQKPEDKLRYIEKLKRQGEKVMMVGDGLNDAGALKQSDVGIAVTDQANNFTPASDGIIRAEVLSKIGRFMQLCRTSRRIIVSSFILSLVYNLIGLFFAVKGILSPLVAAILMPASSISILLLTFGSSQFLARRLRKKHSTEPDQNHFSD